MGWSKRQFVTQAFEEVGLAAYVYDLTPEQLDSALRRLDAMMATWNGKGIRLGYPVPGSPQDSDLGEATNVPDSVNEAIYLNLGIRIAPAFGKTVPIPTLAAAKEAFNVLLQRATFPPEMQLPGTLPLGAGNKHWQNRQPFVDPPVDPLIAGADSAIDFT